MQRGLEFRESVLNLELEVSMRRVCTHGGVIGKWHTHPPLPLSWALALSELIFSLGETA